MSPEEDITPKILDSFRIAQIFRNQANLDSNTKETFSAATFQGEEAPLDGQNQGQDQKSGQKRQKCFNSYGKYIPK